MVAAFPRLQKFIAARVSPEGELGLHLTFGVLVLALAAWAFGGIADEVREAGPILALDQAVAAWLHARTSAGLTRLALAWTNLHSLAGITLLSVLLGAYFYRRGARLWLLTLAVAVPGGLLLNVLLKYLFERARPVSHDAILSLSTYSFPSGHTAAATLFYGIIAAYVVCHTDRWPVRLAVSVLAALMVVLVGASRIYLGVHFFSDTLAAVAESCGWLTVCITAGATLRRRRLGRAAQ